MFFQTLFKLSFDLFLISLIKRIRSQNQFLSQTNIFLRTYCQTEDWKKYIMSEIKLICVDVDGTLVCPTNENQQFIPPENIASIQKCTEHGIHVCVTTGRPRKSALEIAKLAGIEHDYVISYNGGIIMKNGEIIQENRINDETTVKLNEIIKKYNLYAQYYHRG